MVRPMALGRGLKIGLGLFYPLFALDDELPVAAVLAEFAVEAESFAFADAGAHVVADFGAVAEDVVFVAVEGDFEVAAVV